MRVIDKICVLLLLSALCGCGGNGGAPASKTFETHPFPAAPEAPAMLGAYDKMRFAAEHYWDRFLRDARNFPTDSVSVGGVARGEVYEAMSRYILFIGRNLRKDDARVAIGQFFDSLAEVEAADTASSVFEEMARLTRTVLYDPNSSLRNEDLYEPFVRKMSQSAYVPQIDRAGYGFDAEMCLLNQVGTPAADFSFTTRENARGTLYGVKADYTLLFFSNPGCKACGEIVQALQSDEKVQTLIRDGVLAVVNIYIDEDTSNWKDFAGTYPKTWICGYDHRHIIRNDALYNIRAIPSLYLLSADKKVILKDSPKENLIAFIDNLPVKP